MFFCLLFPLFSFTLSFIVNYIYKHIHPLILTTQHFTIYTSVHRFHSQRCRLPWSVRVAATSSLAPHAGPERAKCEASCTCAVSLIGCAGATCGAAPITCPTVGAAPPLPLVIDSTARARCGGPPLPPPTPRASRTVCHAQPVAGLNPFVPCTDTLRPVENVAS